MLPEKEEGREIPDSTEGLHTLFSNMKLSFETGTTKTLKFRKEALTNLINGY